MLSTQQKQLRAARVFVKTRGRGRPGGATRQDPIRRRIVATGRLAFPLECQRLPAPGHAWHTCPLAKTATGDCLGQPGRNQAILPHCTGKRKKAGSSDRPAATTKAAAIRPTSPPDRAEPEAGSDSPRICPPRTSAGASDRPRRRNARERTDRPRDRRS